MFKWLVAKINKTLDTKMQRQFFVGLDIASFESFEVCLVLYLFLLWGGCFSFYKLLFSMVVLFLTLDLGRPILICH